MDHLQFQALLPNAKEQLPEPKDKEATPRMKNRLKQNSKSRISLFIT